MPQYYLDSPNFATATAVYANATLTVLAPDGYYSSNGIVRSQVGGQLSAYAECESCKGYQKPVEGELLLDLYPDAAAAYSLDQLNTSYSGAAIRVRRASDSNEQDIGFTGEFTLDTAALEAFCTGTDGFVAVWYDQSSGGNNATQATAASQPKIYDASTGVELENGVAALRFDGTDDGLNCSTDLRASNGASTVICVQNIPPRASNQSSLVFYKIQRHLIGVDGETTYNTIGISTNETTGEYLKFTGADLDGQRLLFSSWDGSSQFSGVDEIELSVNGSLQTPTLGTGAFGTVGTGVNSIGTRDDITFQHSLGTMQAVIIYPTDQSSNRAGIESNINSRYQIYWDGTVTSLLDTYPDAAAGYSLRALSSSYTGPIVRVRRASDSAETDVYALYNGELNTSALESFCTGTDGFVAVWYDQSGGGNNATQTTTSAQPKIYDASAGVILDNGKPALRLSGAQSMLFNVVTLEADYAMITVNHTDVTGAVSCYLGSNTANRPVWNELSNGTLDMKNGVALGDIIVSNFITFDQHLIFINSSSGSVIASSDGNATTVGSVPGAWNWRQLFKYTFANYNGYSQEVILYPTDQSTNRAGIESNINQAYNIYWDGTVTSVLDDYQGAAAAYSLRALNSFYTGPLVRVRRESDNAERDIRALYNGELDTSALSSFSAGTNAYVAVWYDQSGSGNDATQGTTATQPKIYDASTGVLTLNGKPGVQWDNTDDFLSFPITYPTANLQIHSVFSANDILWIMLSDGSKNIPISQINNTSNSPIDGVNSAVFYKNSTLQSIANRDDVYDTYSINSQLLMTISGEPINTSNATMLWGRLTASFTMNAMHQELIIYTSDQSSNRTGIETNINDYFNIY